jgi:hypothetical protein
MSLFLFDYPPSKETFAFELTVPELADEARNILSGTPTNDTHVKGTIVKEPVAYNAPWSFHLDPNTIQFFREATEVCDAGIQFVEDHLSDVGGSFLPGNCWCPWGSRLLAELAVASGGIETDPRQKCWRLFTVDGHSINFANPARNWKVGSRVNVYFHSLPTRQCPFGDNRWTTITALDDDVPPG